MRWNDAIWFVHRTANSQVLGPNSALHVYRSTDDGATFTETARIPAPADRDIRDPHFYVVGKELFVKALPRTEPAGRTHLQGKGRKRTSRLELGGTLDGGPLTIRTHGDLPSAGDTSYAGIATRSDGRALVSWYSGQLAKDDVWLIGMIEPTNIWHGVIDFAKVR